MSVPWQCPACRCWLAPSTTIHRCGGFATGGNQRDSDATREQRPVIAYGSKPSTKDGRQGYNQGYEAGFLVFWNIYPYHRDKRKAQKAWRNAIHRASQEDINAGAKRYRYDPNRLPQFTKYAEGWLNADGWLDDPLPARLAPGIQPAPPPRITPEEITEIADQLAREREERERGLG